MSGVRAEERGARFAGLSVRNTKLAMNQGALKGSNKKQCIYKKRKDGI